MTIMHYQEKSNFICYRKTIRTIKHYLYQLANNKTFLEQNFIFFVYSPNETDLILVAQE